MDSTLEEAKKVCVLCVCVCVHVPVRVCVYYQCEFAVFTFNDSFHQGVIFVAVNGM